MSQVQQNNVSEEPPPFSEYVFYNENAGSRSSELLAPLTFKIRASYIQDGHTATFQMLHFIFFFLTNVSTEYFKHAAHSPFIS